MNQVILMGRVTKDLELNFTSAGKEMLRFSLAVEENKEKTNIKRNNPILNRIRK